MEPVWSQYQLVQHWDESVQSPGPAMQHMEDWHKLNVQQSPSTEQLAPAPPQPCADVEDGAMAQRSRDPPTIMMIPHVRKNGIADDSTKDRLE